MKDIWPILLQGLAVIVPALAAAAVAWLRSYAQRIAADGAAAKAKSEGADPSEAVKNALSSLNPVVRPRAATAQRLADSATQKPGG